MTLHEIAREISTLSVEERKQLVMIILDSLTAKGSKKHMILEFEGVGAHLYDGTDAQDYVNDLRREWDERVTRSSNV